MELKAFIFDVDGTLAETEECHREAFNQAFEEAGMTGNGDWVWDQTLYRELLKTTGGKERMRAYAQLKNFDLPDVVTLHVRKTQIYNENIMRGKVPLRSGIERLLSEAREKNIRLAIATTTSLPNVHSLVKVNLGKNAINWFEAICTAEDVSRKKPDPEVFQIALDRLNLPADKCLAFEDSRNGLLSATQVNIPTLITQSVYTNDQDFSEALSVLSDLGEPDQPCNFISGRPILGNFASADSLRTMFECG